MEKIAVISDIHANIPALETVLNDIRQRSISRIFCLGDLVGKGPEPARTVDMCREACEIIVQGNHDAIISGNEDFPKIDWHRTQLGRNRLDFLKNLPGTFDFTMSGRQVRLFHASNEGIYHRVHMNAQKEEHIAMFTNTDFTGITAVPDVIGYGDIHSAYMKTFSGKILFNPGSVGNPLDDVTAAYTILEGTYGDQDRNAFSLQVIRLTYDRELAIRRAAEAAMPLYKEWEGELRTARYRHAARLP